jgi:Lumazine binding domain
MFHELDLPSHHVGHLAYVIYRSAYVLYHLQLTRVLHTDLKWYRRMFDWCALWASYALHLGNSRNSENCLGQSVQEKKIRGVTHIVIRLEHQGIRHHPRLREMTVGYVVEKGSITVDGISLTVSGLGGDAGGQWFEVLLIPTTLALTTLGMAAVGAPVKPRGGRNRQIR